MYYLCGKFTKGKCRPILKRQMIDFNYETKFTLADEADISRWISKVISSEGKKEGEINLIFCDDEYLHKLNVDFLNHDTLTDVISFDYSVGNELNGDIFISVERVTENAKDFPFPLMKKSKE